VVGKALVARRLQAARGDRLDDHPGDEPLTAAILDRLLHKAQVINI